MAPLALAMIVGSNIGDAADKSSERLLLLLMVQLKGCHGSAG